MSNRSGDGFLDAVSTDNGRMFAAWGTSVVQACLKRERNAASFVLSRYSRQRAVRFHQRNLSMTTKPFSAVVLSSVIASAFVPITATAQTEPAEETIAAKVAAATTPENLRFKSCPRN